jgi:predicted Zn-dependent peptidase
VIIFALLHTETWSGDVRGQFFRAMFRKKVLDNGLTVLTEEIAHVRSVAIGIWIARGSRHERPEEGGLAHFIEHMVFKGTERRSQARIAQEMDEIGGQTDAFTSHEYAGFHAKVLGEHVPRAVDLLSDIVLAPLFDSEELERERNVIFEEIKGVEDAPEELVHDIFVEQFWPDHPLGRPILGTPETVASFERGDLMAFFRKIYAPSNILVAAAGHLEHAQIERLVEEHFGSLRTPPDGLVERRPIMAPSVRLLEKDLEQAHLVVGTEAPPQASPDRHAAYILNAILGGNLSSRLFQVIREERGLAYSVYSGLSCYRDTGQLTIYAGTAPKNVPELLDLIRIELGRIRSESVEAPELQRAKDHLRGSLLMGAESTGARMSQLARHQMYYGRHVSVEETLRDIEAVSAEDVQRLASSMFENRPLSMTLLGKVSHLHDVPETLVA